MAAGGYAKMKTLPAGELAASTGDADAFSCHHYGAVSEEFNPATRAAWEAAMLRAQYLRVAESELLPTLVAIASADTTRQNNLFGTTFTRATVSFQPVSPNQLDGPGLRRAGKPDRRDARPHPKLHCLPLPDSSHFAQSLHHAALIEKLQGSLFWCLITARAHTIGECRLPIHA